MNDPTQRRIVGGVLRGAHAELRALFQAPEDEVDAEPALSFHPEPVVIISLVGFFDQPRPIVLAHRGGCALGPENTLAAFDLGLAAGADGIELDVHLSADGIPVVHHDDTLDRTTDTTGAVSARTARDLAEVDAGSRFEAGSAFPFRGRGIGVPTLREVLGRYPAALTTIELKVDTAALGEAVVRDVINAGAVSRVCIAGYGTRAAHAARTALPDLACSACLPEVRAALYRSWVWWPPGRVRYGGFQVPEISGRHRIVSRRFVRYAHSAGLKVHVWVVDDEHDMERLLAWGVDGLITDYPALAVQVRQRWLSGRSAGHRV
jgi:glycerophosphoryl diester phosphodiesterase